MSIRTPISQATTNSCPLPKPTSVTCDDVLDACGKTVEAKNKALQLSDLGLKTCTQTVGHMNSEIEQYKEDAGKWYRQPLVVGLLGIAAGALAITLIKH